MDAREFYAQIDKAYKELIDIKREFLSYGGDLKVFLVVWKN